MIRFTEADFGHVGHESFGIHHIERQAPLVTGDADTEAIGQAFGGTVKIVEQCKQRFVIDWRWGSVGFARIRHGSLLVVQ